ncbi:MAG: TolC family outer membrane protein [Syntrophales bacterium]|nr:TolC family outer membrane protein [Syntrophales bacterium]NLN59848.1 TolC family outer membrane protein [Deltaproteobacteria bacterium]
MRLFLRYAISLVVLFLFSGFEPVQGETIQDAVQAILKSNPDIRAAAYNRLAREQEVVQAKSRFFPTLDALGRAGYYRKEHPFKDHDWPREAILSLRQNVFEGGATLSEVQRQQARVKSQAYLLQAQSEVIGLQACKVYLSVLQQQDLLDLAKENLLIHERIYDQMKMRSQAGIDRRADLEQVMGRLALAQSNLVVAKANLEDGRTDYQAVIGHLPEELERPESVEAVIPPTKEEAEQTAIKNYPLLKSAQADLEARQKQHETAKRVNYPSLDLTVDYRWADDVDSIPYEEDLTAMANVRFNIFNGFKDKGRIDETRYLINEAEEIRNSTQRQLVHSIRLSYEAYLAAQDRVKNLEEYAKAAGLTAEAFTAQWTIGRRTMFDVLDTQAEYINAKSDLVTAKYQKRYAEYRVLSGMGLLTKTMELEWPEESVVERDQVAVVKKSASEEGAAPDEASAAEAEMDQED